MLLMVVSVDDDGFHPGEGGCRLVGDSHLNIIHRMALAAVKQALQLTVGSYDVEQPEDHTGYHYYSEQMLPGNCVPEDRSGLSQSRHSCRVNNGGLR